MYYYPEEQRKSNAVLYLILIGLILGLCYLFNTNPSLLRQVTASVSAATGNSLQGAPTITVQKMHDVLCGAGSPMCGQEQQLYNQGVAANINPADALAFYHHESNYGTAGVARTTRSLGNLKCYTGAPWCYDGFAGYNSWLDGSQAWYNLIASYIKGGLTTLPAIIHKYAPGSAGNDENAYVTSVELDVRAWSGA
jgi:hypothetical protein